MCCSDLLGGGLGLLDTEDAYITLKIWDLFLLIQLLTLPLPRYRSPCCPSLISGYWIVLSGGFYVTYYQKCGGKFCYTCAVHLPWGRLHHITYFIIYSTKSIIKLPPSSTVQDQGQIGGRMYGITLALKLLAFICSQIYWYAKLL